MNDLVRLLAAIGLAAIVSTLASWLVMRVKLMDHPDEARKSVVGHGEATPSSGGVGFIPAMLVSLIILSPAILQAESDLVALITGVGIAMALGLVDDVVGLSPRIKLMLQVVVAFGMVWFGVRAETIEPGFGKVREFGLIGGAFFSVLWIVTIKNAVNFMDGANGLAMGLAMFAAIGFTAVFGMTGMLDLAMVSAVLAGGLGGFLVWNMPGKLFAGDAGALGIGAALGGLSVMLVKARPDLVFVPAILLSPFLVDVVLTLLLRLKRGDKFWEAHADHVYQVVLRSVTLEHWQLSIGHWMVAANCAALGVAAALMGHEAPLGIFVGVILMGVWMHIRIRRAAALVASERDAAATSE